MVEYNPFSEEVMTDPYPVYRRLRDEAPAYYIEEYDCWVLSRFEDIWTASMDADSYSTEQGTTSAQLLTKVQPVTPMLNLIDPPRHTYLRSRIRGYFQPRNVAQLEPRVREFAMECIHSFSEKGECDVMGDFSSQIAVKVACMINGFPIEDGDLLVALVQRFFARQEGVVGMTEDGVAAAMEMGAYFEELVKSRRKAAQAQDDVVNAFVTADLDGRPLEPAEIGTHLSMLLIGGAETFPKVFANATYRLFQHPDQRAQLVADQSLIPDAFTELLRYDMPTQFLGRVLKQDVEIHDQIMRKGQVVLFVYPSGNRDEREFENPDVIDIRRRPPRILSFGHGTHACLGINVARLEGKVCMELLSRYMPDYVVETDRLVRLRTEFVQGFESVPIKFKPFRV
ncbi:MAG: cytochrome P450 [Deltaproteobacteria bacterium]|nr:cytochrome P450 [Deltaproteobacteria bacterium]